MKKTAKFIILCTAMFYGFLIKAQSKPLEDFIDPSFQVFKTGIIRYTCDLDGSGSGIKELTEERVLAELKQLAEGDDNLREAYLITYIDEAHDACATVKSYCNPQPIKGYEHKICEALLPEEVQAFNQIFWNRVNLSRYILNTFFPEDKRDGGLCSFNKEQKDFLFSLDPSQHHLLSEENSSHLNKNIWKYFRVQLDIRLDVVRAFYKTQQNQ